MERALDARRLGHLGEARALLDAANLDVGPASTAGVVLRPRGGVAGIAFTGRGAGGTAFFDAATGEPTGLVSQESFVANELETPNVASPGIFVGGSARGGSGVVYDARNRTLLARGPRSLVTQDGATAYVASVEGCTWSRWDLLTGRPVGDLERITRATCFTPPVDVATLSDDGEALIGAAWWDLDTRTIHRTPSGLVVLDGSGARLSPDQNHVAYLLSAAPSDVATPPSFVTIVDRRTGVQRVAVEPLHLTGSTVLDFGESPARVLVIGYDSQWAFGLSSLELLGTYPSWGSGFPPTPALMQPAPASPTPTPPPSETETAPLRARLAEASCTRGGFIVPLDLCSSP